MVYCYVFTHTLRSILVEANGARSIDGELSPRRVADLYRSQGHTPRSSRDRTTRITRRLEIVTAEMFVCFSTCFQILTLQHWGAVSCSNTTSAFFNAIYRAIVDFEGML